MEFIREKIKEKPINKKRVLTQIGIAALCGLAFALALCGAMLLLMPRLTAALTSEDTEMLGSTEDTSTQEGEETTEDFFIPPNTNLSLEDYEKLKNTLYDIGEEAERSIVTIGDAEKWMDSSKDAVKGAGTIIASDNNYIYILTEEKILKDIEKLRVSFVDQTGAAAKLLKRDGNTGIAILTVENRQLSAETRRTIATAKIGSSYEVENGALVIAVGSPLGTSNSILTGNITSIENTVMTQDNNYCVYTTDMAASKNGSGVLLNTKGEVIAMVMQSYASGKEKNVLTAVPVTEIATMIEQLQNGKAVPYIGIYMSTITEDIAKDYNIPMGIYITEVVADSPAMQAGLQSGDVITQINGEAVATDKEYSEKISQLIPGTTCEVMVKRQNGSEYYEVTCVVTIGVL